MDSLRTILYFIAAIRHNSVVACEYNDMTFYLICYIPYIQFAVSEVSSCYCITSIFNFVLRCVLIKYTILLLHVKMLRAEPLKPVMDACWL